MDVTGDCTRNADCNQVNCATTDPTNPATIIITFPSSPNSTCNVRTQSTSEFVNFDETATDSQVLSLEATMGGVTLRFLINLNVNFSPTGNVNTLNYGVST